MTQNLHLRSCDLFIAWRFLTTSLGVAALMASLCAHGAVLDLYTYEEQVRERHAGMQAAADTIAGVALRGDEANQVYAPSLFVKYTHTDDKNPREAVITGIGSEISDTVTSGVKQNFHTGTTATLSYSLEHSEMSGGNRMFLSQPSQYVEKPAIEVHQPLLRNAWGREFDLQDRLALSRTDAQQSGERFKQSQILSAARTAYFRLAFARETVTIQQESLARAEQLSAWLKNRLTRFLAEQSDLIQAQAVVKLHSLELQAARDDQRVAARAFNVLRGSDADNVSEELIRFTPALLPTLKVPVSYEPRDDLKMAAAQMRQTALGAELAAEKNRPSLELFGNYALESTQPKASDVLGRPLDHARPTWSVGLSLNLLLDRALVERINRGYLLEAGGAREQLLRQEFEARDQWQNLLLKYAEAQNRLNLADQLEQIQWQKLDIERGRHQHGRTTLYQVIMFEQDYAQSRLTKLAKLFDVMGLYVQLRSFSAEQL